MNNEQFKSWRKKMKFTQQQAADALGINNRSVVNYERGKRYDDGRAVIIPRTVALACAAIKAGLEPEGAEQ